MVQVLHIHPNLFFYANFVCTSTALFNAALGNVMGIFACPALMSGTYIGDKNRWCQ